MIASLEYIISNSICYDISEEVLNKELIDLGLPKGYFISFFRFVFFSYCIYILYIK